MTSRATEQPQQAAATKYDGRNLKRLAVLAIITGLVGFIMAISSAILPVKQTNATVDWSQQSQPEGVTAPLVSYLPEQMNVTLSCDAAVDAPQNTVLFSTVPTASADDTKMGLQITRGNNAAGVDSISVSSKANLLLEVPVAELENQPADCAILTEVVPAFEEEEENIVRARLVDSTIPALGEDASPLRGEGATDSRTRPQVVGFFSDIPNDVQLPGLKAHMKIDTRFSTSPTPIKIIFMVIGILASIVSLGALWKIDRHSKPYRLEAQASDTRPLPQIRKEQRELSRRAWWTSTGLADITVTVLLVLWHFFGANTSDDGYLLNMARVADGAGYTSNYFRWLGSPESPIGWYYDILQGLTGISTASPFIRLPTLLAGIAGWFIVSRSLLPRLGKAILGNFWAYWLAAMLYLACWMPLNNGLRPEPIEAVLFIACWALVERAIATRSLLPGALAVLSAAFALGAGPTGVMCFAILFAGFRNYWQNVRIAVHTLREGGVKKGTALAGVLSPIVAAGFLILYTVFADQTLGSMREAIRVRTEIGPNLGWFEDKARWIALVGITPDGAVTRRYPIFIMLLLLGIMVYVIARRKPIAGMSTPVFTRVAGISIGSVLLLSLTPTKWTHHFGTFTGIVAVVGAVGAVLLTDHTITLARNRWMAIAAVLVTTGLAFTANNQWWYVSQFGVPTVYGDQAFPTFLGKAYSTWLLGFALLCMLVAGILHFFPGIATKVAAKEGSRLQRVTAWTARRPVLLSVLSTFVVLFSVVSLVGGFIRQYPAYSVGLANVKALGGNPCSLADAVLVEPEPGRWVLQPVGDVDPEEALAGTVRDGFRKDGFPDQIDDRQTEPYTGDALKTPDRQNHKIPPFGLPRDIPILGTYSSTTQLASTLVSSWYKLPAAREDAPLLVMTVAGTLPGEAIRIEWTTQKLTKDDGFRVDGSISPMDPGPTPSWRNVRTRRGHDIPDDATAVRIKVEDKDLGVDKWIAVTPPRAPRLQTLQEVVGSTDPVLIDWSVGLAFPCQRPYGHLNGVAEQPKWRILPNSINAESANAWQDTFGGGPLGWTDLLYYAETVPSYLNKDWYRDWGSLQRFVPRSPESVPATIETSEELHSGLYSPGRMRDTPPPPKRRYD